MRRTREHPPTINELTTDLQRMQRVQANVERLRLEYIEEKRQLAEQQQAALADITQRHEPAQRGVKGEASSTLDQGPGFKIEDEVMEEVKELGSFKTEGLTVGELEKREIELRRRQFGKQPLPSSLDDDSGNKQAMQTFTLLFALLTAAFVWILQRPSSLRSRPPPGTRATASSPRPGPQPPPRGAGRRTQAISL